MANTQSDAQLIGQTLQGKREDFGTLVSRYYSLVYGIALSYTGNSGDAEDISQESFLKAYRSLDSLRDAGKFRAWLARITRNECHTWRERTARLIMSQEPYPGAEPALLPEHEKRDLFEFLWKEIRNLDESSREILVLYYFHGRNTREVAAQLDISPDAAEKRLQRARHQLGERLSDRLDEVLKPYRPTQDKAQRTARAIAAIPVAWKAVHIAQLAGTGTAASSTWLSSTYAWLALLTVLSGVTWFAVTRYASGHASTAPVIVQQSAAGNAPDTAPPLSPGDSAEGIQIGTDDAHGDPPFLTVMVTEEGSQSAPIAGATVTIFSTKHKPLTVKTDEQGKARFFDWILGYMGVTVHHEEHVKLRSTHTLDSAGSTLNLRMFPGRLIAGEVVDAQSGAPIREFVIELSGFSPENSEPWSKGEVNFQNPEGRFTVGNVQSAMSIAARAEGYAWTVVQLREHEDSSDLTIALHEPWTVQGRVRDTLGVPVAGVHVGISRGPRLDWNEESLREVAQTDTDGLFQFPLTDPRDEFVVFLREGYVTKMADMPQKPPLWTDAELLKTCGVRGFIRFGDELVEGAEVCAGPEYPSPAVSDATGSYVLDGLTPGELSIVAALPDHPLEYGRVQEAGQLISLQEGQQATLDFNFEPATSIISGYITVEDATQTGYTVRLHSEHSGAAGIERRTVAVPPGELFWLEEVPSGLTELKAEVGFTQMAPAMRSMRSADSLDAYETYGSHRLTRRVALDVPPMTDVRQDFAFAANAAIQARVSGIPKGYRATVELQGDNAPDEITAIKTTCQGQHHLTSDGLTTFQPLYPGTYTLTLRLHQISPEGAPIRGAAPSWVGKRGHWIDLSPPRTDSATRLLHDEHNPPGTMATVEVAEDSFAEVTLVASE